MESVNLCYQKQGLALRMDSLVAGVHGGICGDGSGAGHFTGHHVGPKI